MNERFSAPILAERFRQFRVPDNNKRLVIQGLVDEVDLRQLKRDYPTLHENSIKRHISEIKYPMVFVEVLAGTIKVHEFSEAPLAKLDEKEFLLWFAEATNLSSSAVKDQFGNDERSIDELEKGILKKWGIKKGDHKMLRAIAYGAMAIKRDEKFWIGLLA